MPVKLDELMGVKAPAGEPVKGEPAKVEKAPAKDEAGKADKADKAANKGL